MIKNTQEKVTSCSADVLDQRKETFNVLALIWVFYITACPLSTEQ